MYIQFPPEPGSSRGLVTFFCHFFLPAVFEGCELKLDLFRHGPPEVGVPLPQCTGLHWLRAGVEDSAPALPDPAGPVGRVQEQRRPLATATPHRRPFAREGNTTRHRFTTRL